MTTTLNALVTNTTLTVALGDTGQVTSFDISKLSPEVLGMALVNGFIGALNNISRGKDEDDKPNSDDVWASMRAKRVAGWQEGSWATRGAGGERSTTALKEAFIEERVASTGATRGQVERSIKDTVKARFGDKESATFSRFMDALALVIAERDLGEADFAKLASNKRDAFLSERRAAIEAKYQKLADDAAKARGKVGGKLDLASIDLGL